MNERYRRILSIDEMYFQEDSPLLLEKAALLFDQQKEINIFQGKFINMQNRSISAAYVDIGCFDISEKKLGVVQGIYLDMDISQNDSFGDNIPVEIPYLDARKFVFTISKIAFIDGEVKECTLQLHRVANAKNISQMEPYKEQYIREINSLNPKVKCRNILVCNEIYWICSCGALNYKNSKECRVCGISMQKQLEVSDFSYLKQKSKSYKENLQKTEEKKRDNIRKIIHRSALGALVIAIVCLGILLISYFVLPQIKYISATKNFASKKYDKAIEEYQELKNYRDSKEKVRESKYLLSKQYIQKEKYNKAQKMLSQIKGYANSTDLIKECESSLREEQYQRAVKLVNKQDYDSAKSILEPIHNYKKADQYITYINTIKSNLYIFDATEIYNSLSKLDIDVSKKYLNNNELMRTYIKKLCGNTFCASYTFVGYSKEKVKRDEKYIFKLSEGEICKYKNYGAAGYDGTWDGYGPNHVIHINGRWYEGMETDSNSGTYEKGFREIEIINANKIKITYLGNKSHTYTKNNKANLKK